ncbi:tyrosine-type recombinase/integrase [Streptomyces sp. Tu102]|uniref:tyrosine-type recombinase/integrase n=1 Tax=Streptomyces sp. Tu102 TaxID=2838019 RepID=UPI001BDBFDF6|nr:tyrosine-type recombinase/integrase [Streptomyces sp. Tu102]MBT1095092.1 tyrosine-type recombinase/integrase [Streptomyces sp. Tu102]
MANTKSKRRQRGRIRPNGAGFQVRVYAGRDPLTKKDIYLHEQAETEVEAEKVRTKLLDQVDENRHPKTQVTMSFLLDRWLGVAGLDETSYERTEGIIRNHLKPTFGDLKAGKLTVEMLELFYARLGQCQEQCEGRRNGKADPRTKQKHLCEPLAPNTVRKIHFTLRPALNRGLRWGYVTTNVATLAEPPSQPKPNPDPPTPEEAALVLNTAWPKDLDWGTFLFMKMVTGSRRGEMCALRWSDIDLERLELVVKHSNNGRRIKDTKTHQHRRQAIDVVTRSVLAAHRSRAEERCKALGGELARDAFVFSGEADSTVPLVPGSVSQRYRRLAKKLKIHTHRLKDLRAYNVTELLRSGADVRTVAGRVGHGGGGATTLKYYAAFLASSDRQAVTAFAKQLPVPEGLLAEQPVTTVINGLRLLCECGNESLWAMLQVTEDGVVALCGQCEAEVQGQPDAAVSPTGRTIRMEPAPPRDLAPWEVIAKDLANAIKDGTMLSGEEVPTVGDIAQAHSVSVGTAHRAFTQLKNDGLIEVSRGRRAVVRRHWEESADAM